jgi:hypothetical protein
MGDYLFILRKEPEPVLLMDQQLDDNCSREDNDQHQPNPQLLLHQFCVFILLRYCDGVGYAVRDSQPSNEDSCDTVADSQVSCDQLERRKLAGNNIHNLECQCL